MRKLFVGKMLARAHDCSQLSSFPGHQINAHNSQEKLISVIWRNLPFLDCSNVMLNDWNGGHLSIVSVDTDVDKNA